MRREGREPLADHAGESPLLSRSGGEKGLRGSGAGTLGVPLDKYVQGSVSDYGKSKQSLWFLFLRTFQSYFKTLDTQSPFKIVNIIRLSVLTIWYLSQRGWVFVQPIPLNYF